MRRKGKGGYRTVQARKRSINSIDKKLHILFKHQTFKKHRCQRIHLPLKTQELHEAVSYTWFYSKRISTSVLGPHVPMHFANFASSGLMKTTQYSSMKESNII